MQGFNKKKRITQKTKTVVEYIVQYFALLYYDYYFTLLN